MNIQKLEERIAKRKEKIKKYTELLKEEKKGLKKDEVALAQLKYETVLRKLSENNIPPEQVLETIEKFLSNSNEDKENHSMKE